MLTLSECLVVLVVKNSRFVRIYINIHKAPLSSKRKSHQGGGHPEWATYLQYA